MESETYGEVFAEVFDSVYGDIAPKDEIATLAELAGPGPVLELGVGTGRVAIPLAEAGLEVHGLDNSPRMLAALAAKPGGASVRTVTALLPDIPLSQRFRLISCVDNTLLLMRTQEQQLQCITNAAERLTEDGVLVLETLGQLDPNPAGGGILLIHMGQKSAVLWATEANSATQRFSTREIILADNQVRVLPFRGRLVSPAELDLMARLAGLRLRARWGGWGQEPFTSASFLAVSVFEKV
ncbi:class I SAM-dependent DNA methyltransferase [Crossiella cryophila]|uniref:SAM-dependent methyltransferase n=1 Tax=Crossiella cryophila TaxID=43355 RepID=A0A7W7FUX1_9PSEU|nr:class I SAM-dependent methyltransferase [Crossiella cryophila]MBB4678455.1 SAM-dependent methyltransferase [Crossiella cryophila]